MPKYKPITTGARMGKHGYWIVTISVAPDKRMQVMIAMPGFTPDQAGDSMETVLSGLSSPARRQ